MVVAYVTYLIKMADETQHYWNQVLFIYLFIYFNFFKYLKELNIDKS